MPLLEGSFGHNFKLFILLVLLACLLYTILIPVISKDRLSAYTGSAIAITCCLIILFVF